MTEQADRALSPGPAPEPPSCCSESRRSRSPSEADHGVRGRRRASARAPTDLLLCVDTESEASESRRKAAMTRLRAVEPFSDCENKPEKKKAQPHQLSKTNAQYHKLFKEVRREETLTQSYTCALQRDILYQGKMFVSENWICFHSKVFGRDTKISIPVMSVTFIKKTKTARLVPNALVIETTNEQHVFVSFLSRNNTFKLLKSLCFHLEVDKTCSGPASCPASLPLDFSGNFCSLDGMVQHRRQGMMESSSSDSQTPDYDKISDFSGLPDTFLSGGKSAEVSVHADVHLQAATHKHGAALRNGLNQAASTCGIPCHTKASQSMSLHAVVLLYLLLAGLLVLSSCHMALKIVALEQRLNSLVSLGQQRRGNAASPGAAGCSSSAEVLQELTNNLFKLEKVQRNLKKLLEET